MAAVQQEFLIPSGPILEAVSERGGLAYLPSLGTLVEDEKTGKTHMVRSPEQWRTYERVRKQLQTARREGQISLFRADEIAIDHLHLHPCMVYGPEWFDFGPRDARIGQTCDSERSNRQ